MCKETIRLALATQAASVTVSVLSTDTPFIPFNPLRYSLVIGGVMEDIIRLNLDSPVNANDGITIKTDESFMSLNLIDHGAIVFGPFRAVCEGGPFFVTYWETVLHPNWAEL